MKKVTFNPAEEGGAALVVAQEICDARCNPAAEGEAAGRAEAAGTFNSAEEGAAALALAKKIRRQHRPTETSAQEFARERRTR